jgi:putative heme-binding domain-containing protein
MRFFVASIWFLGCLAVLAAVPCSASAQDPYGEFVAKSEPKTPDEERKCFHLPPGFTIELVAAEPDIRKPINMNFDNRGRLWVTQSVEYPFPAPANRKGRDVIKILGNVLDGSKSDQVGTFADDLNIPIGVLPIKDGALVYTIPNIYHVWASDGGDHADKREVAYSKFGFADTHGMASSFTWGFDGWIYACHGYSNTSTIKGKDNAAVTMNSGNTYRFKPDGSHIEQFTHGQVNPFGLCFDPLGNLYSADCHTKPVMMLLRGGYYQSFGKPHDGLGFAPEMCDHDHGSTALCGIVYYAAESFPKEYRDDIFVGNVVTNRINRDRLERHGSTLKAIEQPDFLSCDDMWFRPVDMKLGPDGALYVADFYNRIIGHYEVPLTHPGRDRERGRIWRIAYTGPVATTKTNSARNDWSRASVQNLCEDLAHPNLTVRMKATNELVERGGREVITTVRDLMASKNSASSRIHGLWVLECLHALDEPILEACVKDPEPSIRIHAMKVLVERKEISSGEREWVISSLQDKDAFVQRAAAEALSTHPSAANLKPLLGLRHGVPADDTHLLYMVRMALRNQFKSSDAIAMLTNDLQGENDRRALADAAAGSASAAAASYLLKHVKEVKESDESFLRYLHHIARYHSQDAAPEWTQIAKTRHPNEMRLQAASFKAIQQGMQERGANLTEEARHWGDDLVKGLLTAADRESVTTGAELAASLKLSDAVPRLRAIATDKRQDEAKRKPAFDALVAIDPVQSTMALSQVIDDASDSMSMRESAAQHLSGTGQPAAWTVLLKSLAVAPARLQNSIAAGLALNPQSAEKLLDAVTAGKASERLLYEWAVNVRLTKHANLRDRLAKLTRGPSPADKRLQEVMQQRRSGFLASRADSALGTKVFEKNCANCHQIAGKGAKVGPQLDGIGVRGLDRLLEDIIDPNRNVDQSFRSTTLTLKNGQIVTGLLLREEGEVYVIADSQGKEVRVTKGDTEERTVSQLSPMPANLVDQVLEKDFYDLLAYLLTVRQTGQQKPQ